MSKALKMGKHRWRLNEIMARYFIKIPDLAEQLGCSAQSVGNLKNRIDMPRLDGDRLVQICDALNILVAKSGEKGVRIGIADLIEYNFDKST